MKTRYSIISLLVCGGLSGQAGAFVNLNFENAKRPPVFVDGPPSNSQVAIADAFPGWSASLGGRPLATVLYNNLTLGSGSVDLFSTLPPRPEYGADVIAGRHSAGLQNGAGYAALAQTGTIPVGSRSLLFDSAGGVQVALNGSLAPLLELGYTTTGEHTGYVTYSADVSALAGQTVELRFTYPPVGLLATFDNIRFSPEALVIVPEPSTLALVGFGGLALWMLRGSHRS